MQRFWASVMEPIFGILHPKVIVEIGSDLGGNTANLLDYAHEHDATLHVIDPAPGYDAAAWEREHAGTLVFHEALSLDALPQIESFDAVLIDGDHNWYTVFNELKKIEALIHERNEDFPLVMLHDVGWPYGRRDLYYAPETIPAEHRKPYEKKGFVPGEPGLRDEGGLNRHLFNATVEGEPKNGVLTAVEDFLRESEGEFEFVSLPGMHGLGVILPDKVRENADLAEFLRSIALTPFARGYIDRVEKDRLENQISQHEKLAEAHEQLRQERARVRELAPLERWMQTLDDSVSALLQSRQYKAGRKLGDLQRRARGLSDKPTAEDQIQDTLAKFRAWRKSSGDASGDAPGGER